MSRREIEVWTYEDAPSSPQLAPLGITSRQLQRWVEQGKVNHLKIGHRVYFKDEHLNDLVRSFSTSEDSPESVSDEVGVVQLLSMIERSLSGIDKSLKKIVKELR